jgi:phosphoserine phosphatase
LAYQAAVLALVFDFDDTLVPDSTTKLLKSKGVDTDKFWGKDAPRLVDEGYDPPLAYLRLMLEMVGDGKPLGRLRLDDLRNFGTTLDGDFYPGLPDLFTELREMVKEYRDISIEFYIISGGLEAIVLGSNTVKTHFAGVYGCRLGEDPKTGLVAHISRCITFTEKTRYLFEINKGISAKESFANPFLVNKDLQPAERRIPFPNMIYVGDGLTDIPCFSLLRKEHGVAFGVFKPASESAAKKAFTEFLSPGRVVSMHHPRYRKDDELGSLLRAAVSTRCSKILVERQEA